MKALAFRAPGTVAVEERPDPSPAAGEVVIETAASAICGSELHSYRAGGSAGNPGHEAAGVVVALGAGVTRLKLGDRVGASAVAGCGRCRECAAGRYTWCADHRIVVDMHAERFAIPELACHLLPDDVPWEVGVLLAGDGLGVPFHTFQKTRSAGIRTIAVLGLGPIGLGNVLVQAHAGRRVIGIDMAPHRLEMAKRLGAAAVVAAGEGLRERLLEANGGEEVDAVIEAVGRPETVRQAFGLVRRGGTVLCDGECGDEVISPSRDLIRRDITVVGSWFYHFCEFPEMLAAFRSGLRIGDLVTHSFPLAEAQRGYAAFTAGGTGKVMLRGPRG